MYEFEPKPKTAWGPVVLLLFLLGGVSYGTWQLWTRYLNADRELGTLKTRTEALDAEALSHRKKLAEADAERERFAAVGKELEDSKVRLAATESRLHDLSAERAEVDARLAEVRQMTEKFKSLIDAGTLRVTFRRGRAIVELPASVLFDSGSAELSADGTKAVGEVAKVLRSVRRRFVVGGHTDNVPAVKEYKSNWALSTARAVTVLEALVRAGLPPTNLSAAGYAEFDPVASNASADGKQKNRRIEIVLEPYLSGTPPEGTAANAAGAKAPAQ